MTKTGKECECCGSPVRKTLVGDETVDVCSDCGKLNMANTAYCCDDCGKLIESNEDVLS